MEFRKLGDTALELSAITYGAFAIGGNMWGGNEKKDSLAAIQASLDEGVTTLDTAPFYGFGLSEELIAEAIKGQDRTKIQLLTKFGMVWDGSNGNHGEFFFDAATTDGKTLPVYKYAGRANVIKEVEESLKRLGTDYIDLLQLHWPDQTTPIEETMEALNLLIQQGKIRAAGVCNYTVDQLKTAGQVIDLASNQVPYSMLNRKIEAEVIPYAKTKNMGIIAYSPLERGLLSGKYFDADQLKADDHRNGYFGQFDATKVKALLAAIKPIAESKNASLAQLVLRWTTLQPGISIVLAGARNAAQAVSNARAMELTITDQELTFLNQQVDKL
jgi:aryl-alcohol dehydrogenase-like predicted oxidoreductase